MVSGLVSDWRKWSDIQAANVSFGLGMSATPLQVAAAFSALANGGVYTTPTIVSQVLDADGEPIWTHEQDGPKPERIVRKATADTVLEMLTAVVHSKDGTGNQAKIDGYTIAGKTSARTEGQPRGRLLRGPVLLELRRRSAGRESALGDPDLGRQSRRWALRQRGRRAHVRASGRRVLAHLGIAGKGGKLPARDHRASPKIRPSNT